MSRLKRLIVEAHQRSLWQALVVYLGASYAVLEAVQLFRDEFGLPDWLLPAALVLLLFGLPVVVVTSLANRHRGASERSDVPQPGADISTAWPASARSKSCSRSGSQTAAGSRRCLS
jgi:hypothetical protein